MNFKFTSAYTLLKRVFDLVYFDKNDNEQVFDYQWDCNRKSNLIVVVGENASGKSFLRRLMSAVAGKAKIESIPVSMEGRQMSGVVRSFIYGDEQRDATGKNSALTVLTGIKTCQGRESDHIIIWDEPDLGLSESWSTSMGWTLRDFAQNLPEHTLAAVVITHNKALLRELVPLKPHFVHLGDEEIASLEQWLCHTHKGPARVSNPKYRARWDDVFGKKTDDKLN
jgi:hypothetical protein